MPMKAAICAIVKDEGPIIGEWLSYHLALGFDAAIVLDNDSTDGTALIVEAAAHEFDVRAKPIVRDAGYETQENAYVAACREFGAEFDWMAFVDADEFIAPTHDASIKDLLARLDAHHAVCLNWQMFGSAGHLTQPDDLVIEAFRTCAPMSFAPNRHVKSIVRPGNVLGPFNPHVFEVRHAYVDALGRPVTWGEVPGLTSTMLDDAAWFIHHYFVQSRARWSAKLARGYMDETVRRDSDFASYDRNEVLNATALRFNMQTKANLARIAARLGLPLPGSPLRRSVQ
jgi:glycosyltransferase involved in cell wall biosynthesis